SGPADQLRKLADQPIDAPRGVTGAPPRERESDSADIRRGGRLAAAQRRQDTVKEGVHICNAVPGEASCQPVLRGLEQVDRVRISIHEAIISSRRAGCPTSRSVTELL